jgi:hypothetical protein
MSGSHGDRKCHIIYLSTSPQPFYPSTLTTPSMSSLVMSCVAVTPTEVCLPVSGLTFTRFPAVCVAFACLVRESTHILTFAHCATAFTRPSLLTASSEIYEGMFPVVCFVFFYYKTDLFSTRLSYCCSSLVRSKLPLHIPSTITHPLSHLHQFQHR